MAGAPLDDTKIIKSDINKIKPLPHREAIGYWKQKQLLSPDDYKELIDGRDGASVKAFAVAGIEKGEALTTIYNALGDALERGDSFGQFKQKIKEQITAEKWGKKRVATIFRTNIQTAYNVGHWKRYRRDGIAVLVYDAVGDSRTRPTHAALDGKAFPVEDSFWDSWYPPNGFGCRCTTQGMSAIEAEARGIKVENGEDILNESVVLPDGQSQPLLPDQGFDYNPGKAMFGMKPFKRTGSERLGVHKTYKDPPWTSMPAQPLVTVPRSTPRQEATEMLQKQFGTGLMDPWGNHVCFQPKGNYSLINHLYDDHADEAGRRIVFLPSVQSIITNPSEAYTQMRLGDDGRWILRMNYLKRFVLPDGHFKTVNLVADCASPNWIPITMYGVDDREVKNLRKGIKMKL